MTKKPKKKAKPKAKPKPKAVKAKKKKPLFVMEPPLPPITKPMSTDEYLLSLDKLGLSTASQRTAKALGTNVRQIQRFAANTTPVPHAVARLLNMYLEHGLPEDVTE